MLDQSKDNVDLCRAVVCGQRNCICEQQNVCKDKTIFQTNSIFR